MHKSPYIKKQKVIIMLKNKIVYGVLALFVGFALSFSTVNAQVTGEEEGQTMNQFKGKVVDASTGQPLSDVTVRVQGQDKKATTDQEGVFQFDNLSAEGASTEGMGEGGEITIEIEHEGYETLSETISPGDLRSQGQEQGMQEDLKTFELQPKEGDY